MASMAKRRGRSWRLPEGGEQCGERGEYRAPGGLEFRARGVAALDESTVDTHRRGHLVVVHGVADKEHAIDGDVQLPEKCEPVVELAHGVVVIDADECGHPVIEPKVGRGIIE